MSVSFLSLFMLAGLLLGCFFLPAGARKVGIIVAIAGAVVVSGMVVSYITLRQRAAIETYQHVQAAQRAKESALDEQYQRAQPAASPMPSPIWSDAMEDEFEANVYPSQSTAVRALGRRIARTIRGTMSDPNESVKIVLSDPAPGRDLAAELELSLEQQMPGVSCSIEGSGRRSDNDKITVDIRLAGVTGGDIPVPGGSRSQRLTFQSGRVETSLWIKGQRHDILDARFRDAPWLENFSRFARERPWQRYAVARSNEVCTSEEEARQQALTDACGLVVSAFTAKFGPLQQPMRPADIQSRGFIVDQFLQGFDGSAGPIWRQAMLLDTSDSKLQGLKNRPTPAAPPAPVRLPAWIGQIAPALGVLLLILVTYFFLNLATRRYHRPS